jgi:hypothetical protein
MVVQLLEVFCCLLEVFGATAAGAGALPAFGESKGPVTLSNHQRSKKCEFDSCRTLTFRSTDYCWKHQDGKPHESDGPATIRTNLEDPWWESKDEQS